MNTFTGCGFAAAEGHKDVVCRRFFPGLASALVVMIWLTGCASQQPVYDQSAKESLGLIVAKTVIGTHLQPMADSPNMHHMAMFGAVGMLVGAAMEKKSEIPVYEYLIKIADGREIRVTNTYSFNEVGECVKVFESQQATYPRFITSDACRR